ncbi:carboxymuconolactone decarboxylase family protein [Parasphingorhabdus pacifica]
MRELDAKVREQVDPTLNELIKIRVSQLNGCAYCLDMHSKDARAAGESEQRLHTLHAWRETPFFTDRERAVLALAEAVTAVHVPDEVYAAAAEHFGGQELAALVWAITMINGWNRMAVTSRAVPGTYRPDLAG